MCSYHDLLRCPHSCLLYTEDRDKSKITEMVQLSHFCSSESSGFSLSRHYLQNRFFSSLGKPSEATRSPSATCDLLQIRSTRKEGLPLPRFRICAYLLLCVLGRSVSSLPSLPTSIFNRQWKVPDFFAFSLSWQNPSVETLPLTSNKYVHWGYPLFLRFTLLYYEFPVLDHFLLSSRYV